MRMIGRIRTRYIAAPSTPGNRPTLSSARQKSRSSLLGRLAPGAAPMRTHGFPAALTEPLFLWTRDAELKAHPSYVAAKAGDTDAAIELVSDLVVPLVERLEEAAHMESWPLPLTFIAPHAREARGDNAIPQVLAVALSISLGDVDEYIVQTTKVYHTGANAMERLIARASFQGAVQPGAHYVLVDDVTTLGGTLCDLSDYILRRGGIVVAAVVLVNASRSGRLSPAQKTVRRLEEQFGHVIRETFNITPSALSADEAQYLIGFRTTEEIRGRSAAARKETDLRLGSKGIFRSSEGLEHRQGARARPNRVSFPGAAAPHPIRWPASRRRRPTD
jgi:hypothetical protein